jgi:GTP cyclohydrolase II
MNDAVFRALDAVYAEKLPAETKQKTIDTILRAFNVSEGQRIVYACEKFGTDREALARFFTPASAKPKAKRVLKVDTDSDNADEEVKATTPEPVTPKKRGRPPKSPPNIKEERREAKRRVHSLSLVADVAQQVANQTYREEAERAIQAIQKTKTELIPTGNKKQGAGFAWSVEEEQFLKQLIVLGKPINVVDLSKDGKNPRFDRTDKAINNKILDLRQKMLKGAGIRDPPEDADSQ